MDEQIFYSKQLAKTLLLATLAMMAGVAAGHFFLQGRPLLVLMAAAVAFAGIPCGWEMADRIFGKADDLNLLGVGVKLLCACLIGWAALPVRVIYCAVKCCASLEKEAAYAG